MERAWSPLGTSRPRMIRRTGTVAGGRITREEYDLHLPPGHSDGSGRLDPHPLGRGRRTGELFWLLLLFALLGGCAAPDHPSRLPGDLPQGLRAGLGLETLRVLSPGPGLAYYGLLSERGPWAVHLLRVDLGECDLGFRVMKAPKQDGMAGGRSRVTDLWDMEGGAVLAAVNGDFFTPEGLSVGTEVVGGVVSRIRNRPAFAWKPGSDPWMGLPAAQGDSILALGWAVPRRMADGVSQVVGGFPLLLEDGLRVGDLKVTDLPSFSAARHPRTAVGFDPTSEYLWMVVVDGRQEGYSDGMTLPELAELFEGLGVTEAVNLDGGGSTVMVVDGSKVSRPSDAEGERPVVNALGVVRNSAFCGPGSH
jgi:hypothetical protein